MELTRILDTLKDAAGNRARGTITITNPNFIAADGTAVAAGSRVYELLEDDPETPENEAGVVDLWLAPTEASSPAAVYTVEYKLRNGGGYKETWHVPRTGGPYTISQVRGTA